MSQGMAGTGEHPLLAALREVRAGAGGLAGGNCWSLSDPDLAEALDEVAAVKACLAACELALVAEADGRNIGAAQATSTAGWLRARLLMHPGDAARTVRLAAAVHRDCRVTGAALAAGQVNTEQARVITATIGGLPPVEAAVKAKAEEFLIAQAAVLDPLLLGRAGRALTETLTTTGDADGRWARRQDRRHLHLTPAGDGMVTLRGLLDTEAAATVSAALDPLAAPRPAADGSGDPRTAAQRRADALTELARNALAGGSLPETGGIKPTLIITIGLDVLTGQIAGAGLLPSGEPLPASAARRVGCDAKIIPVVLGGASEPLDIGRAARSIPPPMRAALVVRDQACAFPACDRLPAWCEGHHIEHVRREAPVLPSGGERPPTPCCRSSPAKLRAA